eukprot:TRINITY_DN13468_c0_g1_i1.p1 TRINITY_DN13468_c0_g1~~TRINITY_DN13468_c0_g1_i1.p1  ORF type:complete len:106 (-),score=17.78 TRINITY_DN13468_c0_g1_i1:80-397(-)
MALWLLGETISVVEEGVVQVTASTAAFAAVKSDGSVVTWGDDLSGGNSSSVAGKLEEGVVQVIASSAAFAVVKSDGSVVTWGDGRCGGNSSSVAGLLRKGVVHIA